VAALLVRRCIGLPRSFERGEDVVEFVAIAALSSAIGATAVTAVIAWSDLSVSQGVASTWWMQWQADAMGIVVVAPLILCWSRRGPAKPQEKTARDALPRPSHAGGDAGDLQRQPARHPASLPLTFVILPFVIWAALRFEQREVTTLNALICAVAAWHTAEGHGPFTSALPDHAPAAARLCRHRGHHRPGLNAVAASAAGPSTRSRRP